MKRIRCCFPGRQTILATPLVLALAIAPFLAREAVAVEEVEQFLAALKSQGYYDLALDYMEEVKESPRAPQEFMDRYLVERGSLLLDYARSTGDSKLREKLFEDARDVLQAASEANAGTAAGAKASSQLARVLEERGRVAARKAMLPSQEANKKELMAEARALFEQAKDVHEAVAAFYQNELKDRVKFPVNLPASDPRYELRQTYRAEFVHTKLQIATVLYEQAKTHQRDSEEGKKLLEEAAERFGKMYEDYRQWLAGLYARLYQGRCYQDLGDYKKAISYFGDLLDQPAEDPNFRLLIAKTHVQMAECLLAQAEGLTGDDKAAKLEELITRSYDWALKPRGQESQMEDWLGIKYYVAYAQHELANVLDQNDDPQTRNQRSQLRKSAERFTKDVMRVANEYKPRAEDLYAKLGKSTDGSEPKTFEEALQVGKDAVNFMEAEKRKLADVTDPAEKKTVQQAIVDHRNAAIDAFALALSLADDDTDIQQRNLIRYYQCYLFWEMGRYYDAAVVGEYLARNYPDSAGARPCAKIAMASYLKAYNAENNIDREFDAQRLSEIAQYITRRWEGSAEANDASYMLVVFSLQENRLDQAKEFLAAIDPEFINRGKAELRVGQALWSQYIRGVTMDKADPDRPSQSSLDALKTEATEVLEDGVERMREGGVVTPTVASALLSLSQIYLDTQQYEKSVQVLEDEQFGPLRLIINNHPAAQRDAFIEGAYKVALRAYVTKDPPEMDKAEAIMDALEAHVKSTGDAEAAQKLTIIFYSLGKQLQDQMNQIDDDAQKQKLAKSFEVFLDRVARQDHKENAWALQNWVALTYFNLGKGLDTGGQLGSEAKGYYEKAAKEYEKIIADVKSGKLPLPKNEAGEPAEDAVLSIEMRLAECQRALGDYRNALDRLANVLEKKPMMLDAQIMAAHTYQERGKVEDEKWLRYAYMGGRKSKETGKNRIWGWHALSQKVRPYEKFRNIFHEARYNLALCRFLRAERQKTQAEKKKYYEYAEGDISSVAKIYPKLGGAESGWPEKYDALLKKVQRALGKDAIGLKAVNVPEAATSAQSGGVAQSDGG